MAQTLSENGDMLEVFMRSGFHVTSTTERGTVSVRFPIQPDDAYRLAYAGRHQGRWNVVDDGSSRRPRLVTSMTPSLRRFLRDSIRASSQ